MSNGKYSLCCPGDQPSQYPTSGHGHHHRVGQEDQPRRHGRVWVGTLWCRCRDCRIHHGVYVMKKPCPLPWRMRFVNPSASLASLFCLALHYHPSIDFNAPPSPCSRGILPPQRPPVQSSFCRCTSAIRQDTRDRVPAAGALHYPHGQGIAGRAIGAQASHHTCYFCGTCMQCACASHISAADKCTGMYYITVTMNGTKAE